MAKKGRKKNTQNDDLIDDSGFATDEPHDAADDVTYIMGDIKVADGDVDVEAEEFKKASENVSRDADSDGEDDNWDDNYNTKDEDVFLDMADDYDMDNPYGDED